MVRSSRILCGGVGYPIEATQRHLCRRRRRKRYEVGGGYAVAEGNVHCRVRVVIMVAVLHHRLRVSRLCSVVRRQMLALEVMGNPVANVSAGSAHGDDRKCNQTAETKGRRTHQSIIYVRGGRSAQGVQSHRCNPCCPDASSCRGVASLIRLPSRSHDSHPRPVQFPQPKARRSASLRVVHRGCAGGVHPPRRSRRGWLSCATRRRWNRTTGARRLARAAAEPCGARRSLHACARIRR